MGVDFHVGDLVWMPGDVTSRGRIVDIRDHGLEIWVRPLDPNRHVYYTFYDQLELDNVLDLIVKALGPD